MISAKESNKFSIHSSKQSLKELTTFLPHPAGGKAASWVGPKIVLDHVRVYIMYVYKNYVCVLWVSSPLVVYDAIDNASSSRAHED